MKKEPIRMVVCDLCHTEERMRTKYGYGWNFKMPKKWVMIDKENFLNDTNLDYCPKCVKMLLEGKKK